MKTRKYKITVLSDLKDTALESLNSTISLAKMIDAEIEVFHVKKPTDIVTSDSQLSAFRIINEQHTVTKKKLDNLISSVSVTNGLNINYSYTFGNVKNEIEDYITTNKPDIIVLGKRKSKSIKLTGDSLTDFIIKTYKGVILITGNESILELNQELSLGVLNSKSLTFNSEFGQDLLNHSQKPLKAFRFVKQDNPSKKNETQSNTKTVEFVFEHNDYTVKNLSNYLLKNDVNILYLDRENYDNNTEGLKQSDIKSVINNLNISIILSAEQQLQSNPV